MTIINPGLVLKLFDKPDEVRIMTKGRFEVVNLNGQTFGRATYEPGWKWSTHVGPERGARWCLVEHLVYVVAGSCSVAFRNGDEIHIGAGGLFYVPPVAHDSWVIGDIPYVSFHLLGAEGYAK